MNLEATMESPTQVATEKKPKVNHFLALRKEVDQYFKLNNISDKGEKKFIWIALFIVVVYLLCYILIYSYFFTYLLVDEFCSYSRT